MKRSPDFWYILTKDYWHPIPPSVDVVHADTRERAETYVRLQNPNAVVLATLNRAELKAFGEQINRIVKL